MDRVGSGVRFCVSRIQLEGLRFSSGFSVQAV